MANSKTLMLNTALTRVGAAPIISIDDDSNNARTLARVYELSLRSALGDAKPNFAKKRVKLTQVNVSLEWTESDDGYIYQKPADWVSGIRVSPRTARIKEEGDYIISDTPNLGVLYICYIDVPEKYSSCFIDAFIDKLCSTIAYSVINSASIGDTKLKLYESVSLPKAQSSNSQFGVITEAQDGAWENAKYSNINPEA